MGAGTEFLYNILSFVRTYILLIISKSFHIKSTPSSIAPLQLVEHTHVIVDFGFIKAMGALLCNYILSTVVINVECGFLFIT
jgi:hypothetical protein